MSFKRPIIKRSLPVYRVGEGKFRIGAQLGITAQFTDPKNHMWDLVSNLDGRPFEEVIEDVLKLHPELTSDDVLSGIKMLADRNLLDEASTSHCEVLERFMPNVQYFAATPNNSTDTAESYQEQLLDSHVLLLGAGGGGSNIATLLSGVGFGQLTIVDYDTVEEGNLGRQFLYRADDIGKSKVKTAKAAIEAMNPHIQVNAVERRVSSVEDVASLLPGVDIVVCALDEPPFLAQRRVNKAIVEVNLPCVFGATQVTHGRVFTIIPGKTGCFDCLHLYYSKNDSLFVKQFAGFQRSNFEPPSIAYAPAIWQVALSMVDEAVRVVTGYADVVSLGRQYELDYMDYSAFAHNPWPRYEECPTCGNGDYSEWPIFSEYSLTSE